MSKIAHPLQIVEQTQAELDVLYATIASLAGGPAVDAMISILRAADDALAAVRDLALLVDPDGGNRLPDLLTMIDAGRNQCRGSAFRFG